MSADEVSAQLMCVVCTCVLVDADVRIRFESALLARCRDVRTVVVMRTPLLARHCALSLFLLLINIVVCSADDADKAPVVADAPHTVDR